MKIKTRIISVMMIMMMVISGMSFSTYAATSTKGVVYVDVTQDYAKAQKVLALVNKQRAKRGLRKLKLDKSLTNAAVQRAAEISMVIPTTSPHKRPDGRYAKTVHKLATRENCAEGYFSGPSEVVSTWMHSKGHKATALLKSAKSAGVAYVHNPADEDAGYYVLIVSNSKVKKVEKSKKQVSSTKKVVALNKYLKKKYFFLEVINDRTTLGIGDTAEIKTYYFGPKTIDFTSPEMNPKSFTWKSSDTSVAKVSSKGVVTAVGPGKATIKAKLKKGPSVTLSKTFTVDPPEAYFDKLTDYMQSGNAQFTDGLGYGYEDGDIYLKSYYGGKMMYDPITDPDTGSEIEVYDYRGDYVIAQESRIGEELAIMSSFAYCHDNKIMLHHRLFMIISKNGDKLDDNVTFIYDCMDEYDNYLYKLKATSKRGAVDIDNLDWEVVQESTGEEIDYELIEDQLYDLFFSDGFGYLYRKTGVRLRNMGIKRV